MNQQPVSLFSKLKSVIEALARVAESNSNAFEETTYQQASFLHVAEEILSKKEPILALLSQHDSPCYLLDTKNLARSIARYKAAFSKTLPLAKHFYAVKLNHEPHLMAQIFAAGFGADVSSARELFLAKEAGAKQFLFSGPGKTTEELQKALSSNLDVTINIDNFSELARLKKIVTKKINVGVRVTFSEHGAWDKFGIPIDKLFDFYTECSTSPNIHLTGIQFHISWNKNGEKYTAAIARLAKELNQPSLKPLLEQLSFIDIGGGFRPYNSEGFFADDTPAGAIISAAESFLPDDSGLDFSLPPYLLTEAVEIEKYAEAIGDAVKKHLMPLSTFQFYTEPGRIIVNDAMHVAVKVVDIKSQECVITDGGTNIVGFERFEFDYFPLINLSNPSKVEREATVYGSLCMPQDYWGKRIFSGTFTEGDVIIIPYQGALTYSNMNDFIKGKAPVLVLE